MKAVAVLALLTVTGLGLCGCGRKGDPLTPPSYQNSSRQSEAKPARPGPPKYNPGDIPSGESPLDPAQDGD